MKYTVEELEINKDLFERKLNEEKAKEPKDDIARLLIQKEGTFSQNHELRGRHGGKQQRVDKTGEKSAGEDA